MSYANRFAKSLTARLLLGSVAAGLLACTPEAAVPVSDTTSPSPVSEVAPENLNVEPAIAAEPEAARPSNDSNRSPIALSASPDVNCDEPQTQLAMNICSGKDYKSADAELNQAYQALLSQQSEAGKVALEDAEIAWLSFRDRDCAFSKSFYEGGSIAPLIYNDCMEQRTLTRTAELRLPLIRDSSYAEADADLNRTYQLLMAETRAARKDGLVDAQLAWIDYRDRHCAFEARYQPVSIDENQCLARITETRIQQLANAVERASL